MVANMSEYVVDGFVAQPYQNGRVQLELHTDTEKINISLSNICMHDLMHWFLVVSPLAYTRLMQDMRNMR